MRRLGEDGGLGLRRPGPPVMLARGPEPRRSKSKEGRGKSGLRERGEGTDKEWLKVVKGEVVAEWVGSMGAWSDEETTALEEGIEVVILEGTVVVVKEAEVIVLIEPEGPLAKGRSSGMEGPGDNAPGPRIDAAVLAIE